MDNTSQEFINFSLSSTLSPVECLKESPLSVIFLYSVRLVCTVIGIPAHMWCLHFYVCGSASKFIPTHVFFLNYSVMELIYCLECLPELLNVLVFKNYVVFKVLFFSFGLSWTGRTLLQTCICIEQYFAVVHPLIFLRYKDIKHRIVMVAVLWFIAFGYGLYTIKLKEFPDPFFNTVFFIAISVILFCCVSVLYALKQSHKRISDQTSRCVGKQQTRDVFSTLFSALLIILFTYFPQVLLGFLTFVDLGQKLFKCSILSFLNSLNALSVIITPLLKMYKEGRLKLNSSSGQ